MSLKQLKKRLNPVAQKAGLYLSYELDESEYVGTMPVFDHEVKYLLENTDYERPPTVGGVSLTATKLHPERGTVHDATVRKIDPDNPRWQWHVHLWYVVDGAPGESYYEVFSHYEMRPDFKKLNGEDKSEMIGRLKIHYRPEYNVDYFQGRADKVVSDLVND